jgi:uncharacterized protein (TIGR00369 family)
MASGAASTFPLHIPFVEHLGFELLRWEAGEAEIRLALQAEHLNSWQVAHGGLLMTLLDVAMAHAARSIHKAERDGGPGLVTVEMKTSFLRPGEGLLRATGSLLHRSTTLAFCDGSVYNERGERCAHATATFKYLRALPSGGRELRTVRPTTGTD